MTLLFILTFLATLLFTFFVRKILRDADITDSPIVTEHRHKAGTPTMGGLAMLLGILLAAAVYFTQRNLVLTVIIMMGSGVVGLLDDLLGLKVKELQKVVRNISHQPVEIGRLTLKPKEEARVTTEKAKGDLKTLLNEEKVEVIGEVPIKSEVTERDKIIAQIVISLFLVATGAVSSGVLGFELGILIIPVVIFGVIGSINSVNLIDGMDGLAAGILAIASASCAIITFNNGNLSGALPFVALTGISLGFLVFNRYPASIFMGDTGSFALGAGYITAGFLGDVIYFAVLALAIPIISVIVSLLHRVHVIKLPVEPLHHTLHYKGLSEKKIIAIYWGITFLICIVAITTHQFIS
ncbi:glycosyltransferase family 4 protein [Methanobacterium sp. CWC-01]|jgi:phospho-N-acetylmuramoyl-pentapeptide-transferase|uniref:glycosyltransferase family 4 protein n=1 Tax=Methanobacterium aridiramus TaxID=2584467 RepID=UPI002575AF75|nr:glycosyltransferase family 4 protein [Methanobacterium sp. CWC-01]